MRELQNLIKMSKYAGGRVDLTQASGGNSSVKTGEIMLIKSSGCLLGDLDVTVGYAKVNLKKLLQILADNEIINTKDPSTLSQVVSPKIMSAVIAGAKPSIEVLMHGQLGKYVLHTHPITINALTCQKNWQQQLQKLFPQALLIEYINPGIALDIRLYHELRDKNVDINEQVIIFLQNHGLVVSSNSMEEVIATTEAIVKKAEDYLRYTHEEYIVSTKIDDYLATKDEDNQICYLCQDQEINKILQSNKELFFTPIFAPVMYLYNGMSAFEIKELHDKKPLQNYRDKFNENPRIILYKNKVYLHAQNLGKAHEMEDVLKANLFILIKAKDNIRYLTEKELEELSYL